MTTDPKVLVVELRELQDSWAESIKRMDSNADNGIMAVIRAEQHDTFKNAADAIEQLQKELADECASRTRWWERAGEQRQRAEKAERERDEALEDSERNFQMFKTSDLYARELAVRAEKAESALAAATAEREGLIVATESYFIALDRGCSDNFRDAMQEYSRLLSELRSTLTKAKGATNG